MSSRYIEALRADSGRYASRTLNEVTNTGVRGFLREFHAGLNEKLPNSGTESQKNKHFIPQIMTLALQALFKDCVGKGNEFRTEPRLCDLVESDSTNNLELKNLIAKKRADFEISSGKATLIVEFKSLLDFNNFTAAMVELQLVKMLTRSERWKKIYTASLHLYPQEKDVEHYKKLDRFLNKGESACDKIWCFARGKSENTEFDLESIENFRNFVVKEVFT